MLDANLFCRAGDANRDPIGDAHQQIAAPAVGFRQAFTVQVDDFSARRAAWNPHAQPCSGKSTNRFHAALCRAFGFYFQIAAQIRAAQFEPKIRQRFDAKPDETAGKSSGARQAKIRSRRGVWRNDEPVNFPAGGIGGIGYADFAGGAA